MEPNSLVFARKKEKTLIFVNEKIFTLHKSNPMYLESTKPNWNIGCVIIIWTYLQFEEAHWKKLIFVTYIYVTKINK